MTPLEFINTIYLGDRGIKGICIDSWNHVIKINVTEISRIRSSDGQWNYYNDENVLNGFLVFEEVSYFTITPVGAIPDDYIDFHDVEKSAEGNFTFTLEAEGFIKSERVQTKLAIMFERLYIETPDGEKIVD